MIAVYKGLSTVVIFYYVLMDGGDKGRPGFEIFISCVGETKDSSFRVLSFSNSVSG